MKIVLIYGHRPLFPTLDDVKTLSVIVVNAERMFRQSHCQTASNGRWHIFHLPGQNGPVSGTRQQDKSDTYRGDSFSHLGIMVLIGVLLVSLLHTQTETKKVCDKIHN